MKESFQHFQNDGYPYGYHQLNFIPKLLEFSLSLSVELSMEVYKIGLGKCKQVKSIDMKVLIPTRLEKLEYL